ncbi:34672_t:CDS:1 [Racocetra persica]|uniref:34672_t:CDS:1 n=1 Tax=Racocetra persica TaxID=160502 RepID=A0ACA9PWN8_9GLOM|nr:34672_t:CDS:1 [Racocetra persica]
MSTSPISPPHPSTTNASSQSDDRSGIKIAAGIIGSIISLLIAAGIIIYYRRKRQRSKENSAELSIKDGSDMISNVAMAAKSIEDNHSALSNIMVTKVSSVRVFHDTDDYSGRNSSTTIGLISTGGADDGDDKNSLSEYDQNWI